MSVIQSTLVGNTINTNREGATIEASNSDVSVVASVLANPAGQPAGGECVGSDTTFADDGYNTVDDTSCDLSAPSSIAATTTEQADAIELLGSLSGNGGTTETVLPLSGNPALTRVPYQTIANVSGSNVALCPSVDQRGDATLANASCDAGSVQVDPAPKVTSVSPASGPVSGGATITVVGSGFVVGATSVDLTKNKSPSLVATDVKVISSTELTAVTPSGGQLGKKYFVEVVSPGGTSPTTKSVSLAYLPAPTATKISPATGPTSGHTVVTITGSEFVEGATVDFGSVRALKVTYLSSTSLRAVTPAGLAGPVKVTVSTPSGTSKKKLSYTYKATSKATSVNLLSGRKTPVSADMSIPCPTGTTYGDHRSARVTYYLSCL